MKFSTNNIIVAVIASIIIFGIYKKFTSKAVSPKNIAKNSTVSQVPQVINEVPQVPEAPSVVESSTASNSQFQSYKRIQELDILCFRISQNIFFLPRDYAVRITSQGINSFALPKALAQCLKTGPIKLWVSDYDPVYNLPYRYYLQIATNILKIEEVKVISDSDKNINQKLFSTLNLDQDYLNIKIDTITVSDFRFHHTAIGNSLFARIEETTRSPDSRSLELIKKFENNDLINFTYLPPISPDLDIENLIKEPIDNFTIPSDLLLLGENIALAHYFKFKKEIKLFVKTQNSDYRRVDQNFFLQFEEFKRQITESVIFDVRNNSHSKRLKIKNAISLPLKMNGNFNPFKVLTALEDPQRRHIIISQEKLAGEFIESHMKTSNKSILMYSTGDGDPMHRRIARKLPKNLFERTKGFQYGFHYLLVHSYFFNSIPFVYESSAVTPADIKDIDNLLLLRN